MTNWQTIGRAAVNRQHKIVGRMEECSSIKRKRELVYQSNRLTDLARLSELAREFHL